MDRSGCTVVSSERCGCAAVSKERRDGIGCRKVAVAPRISGGRWTSRRWRLGSPEKNIVVEGEEETTSQEEEKLTRRMKNLNIDTDYMDVFIGEFSVFGKIFHKCLHNLVQISERCEETNLEFNWEKCHFMVQEGLLLGHRASNKGLEVDKAKINVIEKLPPPTNIKGVISFLGNGGFYKRFVKDFFQISSPCANCCSTIQLLNLMKHAL